MQELVALLDNILDNSNSDRQVRVGLVSAQCLAEWLLKLEKEQIIKAYDAGFQNSNKSGQYEPGGYYFNETFNK